MKKSSPEGEDDRSNDKSIHVDSRSIILGIVQ